MKKQINILLCKFLMVIYRCFSHLLLKPLHAHYNVNTIGTKSYSYILTVVTGTHVDELSFKLRKTVGLFIYENKPKVGDAFSIEDLNNKLLFAKYIAYKQKE